MLFLPLLSLLLLSQPTVQVLARAHNRPRNYDAMQRRRIKPRDSPNGRCGAGFQGYTCTATGTTNKCCSQFGWCGDSTGHCGAGCQTAYGTCTTTTVTTPSTGARPKLGSVPYGTEITACTKQKTIALTFDDGPYIYTAALLDLLKAKSVKATFFITGNNLDKGEIDSTAQWTSVIQRMISEGHQIASHTWTHPDLSTLDEATRRYEMVRNEQAFLSILGKYPTYMRPPFISCNDACLATLDALGYHVIIWDLDTNDYNNDASTLIQDSKNRVDTALAERWDSYDSIAHDIHYQTVYNLTAYQIDAGKVAGYSHVRLGECLGDDEDNWYRTKL